MPTTSMDMDVLASIPLPAALTSAEGIVRHANTRWRRNLGGDVALADVVCLTDDRPFELPGESLPCECQIALGDGTRRWFSVHASPHPAESNGRSGYLVCLVDVHERHLRELELERQVQMQLNMLDASVDCIKVVSVDGTLLHLNRAGSEALGVSKESAAGRKWLALLPAEVRARGEVALEQAAAGETARFPGCSQLPDEPPQYWDNVLTPLTDSSGAVASVLCVSRNTSSQRAVEERLRLAIRATNDAIRDWELTEGEIVWNEALERCYGYAPSPAQRNVEWWLSHIHPQDRARVESYFQSLIAGRRDDYAVEYRFAKADGHYVEVRDRGCLSRGPSGQVVRIVGSLLDQTERKAVERSFEAVNKSLNAQIAERTDELNHLWNMSPDLMVVLDGQGAIRRANPAAHRILGYDGVDVVGHHISEFVNPDDVPRLHDALACMGAQLKPAMELRHHHRNGQCHWVSWVGVVTDSAIYVAGRHVTAEREARALLEQTEDALRQAQKMEALGQLTGGIAHDFNNLLASISGALAVMRLRVHKGNGPDLARYLDMGENSVRRAAALTQRLLAFSRRQALAPRPTDVNQLVLGMADLIASTVGPAIRVSVQAEPALWTTQVDGPQLENALLNLCINARDAMPDGGPLTLVTTNQSFGPDAADPRAIPPGDYVGVAVVDRGTGMPASVVQRVFEPFFTTKPPGQGTGLGLSMVYGFARQSGGHIRVDSEPGCGTTMSLFLPRHIGDAAADEPTASPGTLDAGAGETVLLIEDEDSVRGLLTEVLQETGYTVLNAADGPAGLAWLQSTTPVDLLLIDMGLPGGMNGRQVADAGRALRPALKVLFITGYAEGIAAGSALTDDHMEIMTKPFDFAALLEKVAAVLGKRSSVRH